MLIDPRPIYHFRASHPGASTSIHQRTRRCRLDRLQPTSRVRVLLLWPARRPVLRAGSAPPYPCGPARAGAAARCGSSSPEHRRSPVTDSNSSRISAQSTFCSGTARFHRGPDRRMGQDLAAAPRAYLFGLPTPPRKTRCRCVSRVAAPRPWPKRCVLAPPIPGLCEWRMTWLPRRARFPRARRLNRGCHTRRRRPTETRDRSRAVRFPHVRERALRPARHAEIGASAGLISLDRFAYRPGVGVGRMSGLHRHGVEGGRPPSDPPLAFATGLRPSPAARHRRSCRSSAPQAYSGHRPSASRSFRRWRRLGSCGVRWSARCGSVLRRGCRSARRTPPRSSITRSSCSIRLAISGRDRRCLDGAGAEATEAAPLPAAPEPAVLGVPLDACACSRSHRMAGRRTPLLRARTATCAASRCYDSGGRIQRICRVDSARRAPCGPTNRPRCTRSCAWRGPSNSNSQSPAICRARVGRRRSGHSDEPTRRLDGACALSSFRSWSPPSSSGRAPQR